MSESPTSTAPASVSPAGPPEPAEHRFFTTSRCMDHLAPPGFPEKPERLAGILEHLRRVGAVIDDKPRPEPVSAAVAAVHEADYLRRFEKAVARGDGLLDSADNPLGPATWEAARAAVDAALRAVDWVLDGSRRRAFVAARPPGHHANASTAMGFCYFSNISVAAQYALDRLSEAGNPRKVAIVDFDVHHGNGTQDVFYGRGDVLFVSLHQFPFYPGTGAASETGDGPGEGATLNLPMPAGCGDQEYFELMEERVLPALRDYAPDLLLASAGFDAWRADPLGGMRVSLEGFAAIGRQLEAAADELCAGRLVSLLEGGYDVESLPSLVGAYALPPAPGAASS